MYRIFINAGGEIGTNSSGSRFLRIGCAHYFTMFKDGIFTFQYLHHHRT